MLYAYPVTTFEASAVCLAVPLPHRRMTVFLAVIYVGTPMIAVVFARTLDALVKPVALDLIQLAWRSLPTAIVAIMILSSIAPGQRCRRKRRGQN
jgi:hypothetical protein